MTAAPRRARRRIQPAREFFLRETLAFLVEREVASKDERRIETAIKIAHFPAARQLDRQDPGPQARGVPLGCSRRSPTAARPARRRQVPSRHRARPRGDPPPIFRPVRQRIALVAAVINAPANGRPE